MVMWEKVVDCFQFCEQFGILFDVVVEVIDDVLINIIQRQFVDGGILVINICGYLKQIVQVVWL